MQYRTYLNRWTQYCREKAVSTLTPTIEQVIEFLTTLYKSGLGYSAINTARSALSSVVVIESSLPLGEHPVICRFMKGVFGLRPSLPKYSNIWDVSQVFSYFRTFPNLANISLKQLSYKTATLLCLLTGQRCQTIHTIDIRNIQVFPNKIRIPLYQVLKTTMPRKHQAPLELISYPADPQLCIVTMLSHYLEQTKSLRGEHKALFISFHKPHNPVSTDTISRWIKATLKEAGINTDTFTAHSCRSASTSASKQAGTNLTGIIKSAGWSNERTFAKHYDREIQGQNFGNFVLN